MWQSFLVSLREGIDILFFLGLLMVYLKQKGKPEYIRYFFFGALSGFIVILVGGFTLFDQLQSMNIVIRERFLGFMTLFVSLIVAYFVVLLKKQSESENDKIEKMFKNDVSSISIFAMTFLTVFREGLEIVMFNLAMLNESMIKIMIGTLGGLAIALAFNGVIFKTTRKLNVKWVFTIMSLLMIVVGAKMFGEGLVNFIPKGGSLLENGAAVVYALVCMLYYMKGKVIGKQR